MPTRFSRQAYTERLSDIAAQAKRIIESEFSGCEVVVFGSVAKQLANATSDIDLAVFFDSLKKRKQDISAEIQVLLRHLMISHEVSFDIVVFEKSERSRPEKSTLLTEVLQNA